MAVGDKIKCTIVPETIRHYNDEWMSGIVVASVKEVQEGKPALNRFGEITLKGNMPKPKVGEPYHLTAIEVEDPKYGKQYNVEIMSGIFNFDTNDKSGQRKFLSTLFTDKQVQAMYDALPNPFESFNQGKLGDLVQIKGCGMTNAVKWLDKFNQTLPLSKIYIELEDYGLTNNMINRLLKQYKSADLVIQKVKNNPYMLCEVDGIGWLKADQIAMAGGIGEFSTNRIKAFILHYLEQEGMKGDSYVSCDELMGAIISTMGDEVPDSAIATSIHELGDKLWYNDTKDKMGLRKYRNLEESIGKHLIRLLKSKGDFKYDNWGDVIKHKEHQQGWNFTEQQVLGIKTVLENQVTMVTGSAGTGKSSIVAGMLAVLKNYSFAQCALAGRAAARLTEVTHQEGYTIHRLLAYPTIDEEGKMGFGHNEKNPLLQDIIIVDEISMVDGFLFLNLIRAVKDGAKLILLGDIGQLESIGCCNIAYDIINSGVIPVVQLTQIHRQAQSSAVVTESRKIREGVPIIPRDWVGVETRGELQDMVVDCYSDKSNTFYKVMQYFSTELENINNIMDIQIIVPQKDRGGACTWNLNNAVQELYNPAEEGKDEIDVFYAKGKVGVLRIGDKVINTKNNYKTMLYDPDYEPTQEDFDNIEEGYEITGKKTPIYNGSMGIVTEIDKKKGCIIVSFTDIGEIVIPRDHVKFIELGYANTCHKMQGSEAKIVIVGIDFDSYQSLNREWLYTAPTRAKQLCYLVAQNSALLYGISQSGVSTKMTHLVDVLNELMNPKLVF